MQDTVRYTQGCTSSHLRGFCGLNHCAEHCKVPPFNKDLLFQQWGLLSRFNDWRMQLITLWSPQLPMRLIEAVIGFGSTSFSAWSSFIPPHPLHCWLLIQHFARKILSQSLLSRTPNLQQSHFTPSTAMTLPEAPGITNIMATSKPDSALSPFYASSLGQGQRRENLKRCILGIVQWVVQLILMHTEGKRDSLVYAGSSSVFIPDFIAEYSLSFILTFKPLAS